MPEKAPRITGSSTKTPDSTDTGGKVKPEEVITTYHSAIDEDCKRETFSVTTGLQNILKKYSFNSEEE